MRQTETERREAERWAIQAQIRECENTINELNGEFGKLNQKIEMQQEAKNRYDNMCIQVEEAKARKRGSTRGIEPYVRNVKFLYGYQSRMYEFLDGQRAVRNQRYMEDVVERMINAINANVQRREELKSQMVECHDKIAKLCRKLGGI